MGRGLDWQEARHLLTFASMKRKRSISHWLCAVLAGVLLLLPATVAAQKEQLKGQPQPPPTVEGGKGALKAAVPHDTLVGGDGFIPRTVIDSFPRQPMDSIEAPPPGTRVSREDLDASQARIQAMHLRIQVMDSALTVYRADTSGQWPTQRISEIDSLLSDSKSRLALAEQDLARLNKRWETLKNPPAHKETAPSPEAAPAKPKPSPSKPKPTSPPTNPPKASTSPSPTPGTPASPSGKGKIKGK